MGIAITFGKNLVFLDFFHPILIKIPYCESSQTKAFFVLHFSLQISQFLSLKVNYGLKNHRLWKRLFHDLFSPPLVFLKYYGLMKTFEHKISPCVKSTTMYRRKNCNQCVMVVITKITKKRCTTTNLVYCNLQKTTE